MGNEYIAARKEYVERVKKELLGPGSEVSIPDEEHELISSSPSVRYSIGMMKRYRKTRILLPITLTEQQQMLPKERTRQ